MPKKNEKKVLSMIGVSKGWSKISLIYGNFYNDWRTSKERIEAVQYVLEKEDYLSKKMEKYIFPREEKMKLLMFWFMSCNFVKQKSVLLASL